MKFKTVREGEQALVFNHLGEADLIVGPRRVFLYRKQLQFLQHYTAGPDEYLKVTYANGLVTNHPGPCEMFRNSLEHEKIVVQPATHIDANHVIIVYKRLQDKSVQRRIVEGPAVFMPEAEEWLHYFEWHGEDPKEPGHMVMNANKFTQLPIVPEQFYYNVREVRTTDDTTLTVKMMIFYKLVDIITMLEATHDPIADMINGVCADIIAFAGKLSYEQFLGSTQELGDLKQYPQLIQRAQRIGYVITKVVYRGYHAGDHLQGMHDNTIQSRTQMRLDSELAEQKQKLTEFKLQKEQARTETKQLMERRAAEHKQKLATLHQEHQMQLTNLEHQVAIEMSTIETAANLESQRAKDADELEHLGKLQELDINLTQYLVSKQPPQIDEQVHVGIKQDTLRF